VNGRNGPEPSATWGGDPRTSDLLRVEEACERFEAGWKAGRRPAVEDELAGAGGPVRPMLLRELLLVDMSYRRRAGERPDADEYLARFPDDGAAVRAAIAAAMKGEPPSALGRTAAVATDLLLGILALQNDFITREQLLESFHVWVADRSRPLGQVLGDRGALDPDRLTLLGALVGEHVKAHGGDPERSLASLGALGSIRGDLEKAADPAVQACLSAATTLAPRHDRGTEATAAAPPGLRPAGERFRVLRFHRRGGLGAVYVARDAELGREVALKEIRPDMAGVGGLRARFVLEAEITGGLEHPGIVPVYSLGAYDDGRPFYAMRFVEGDSLDEAIKAYHASGPRAHPTAVEFRRLLGRFVDVCEAIAFAHSKGVLHRDLKPHNVMLGRYGETLLIDWGLAKATGRREPPGPGDAPEATLAPPSGGSHEPTAGVIGSPAYMSPEQAAARHDALGPATDVYGLGAILYGLLTGVPPVTGRTTEDVLDRARRGEIVPPQERNPRAPAPLEAVCLKALARSPADRYPSARALADDVERWLADEPVSAWREPLAVRARRWMRRHRTAMTAAAVGLLAGVVGLAALAAVQSKANRDLTEAHHTVSNSLVAEMKAKKDTEEALAQKGEALARSKESLRRAEGVLTFLKDDVLAAARPEKQEGGLGVGVSVRQAVDAAEPRIAARFQGQPLVEADVRDTLGVTYYYLGEATLAVRQHERAAELRRAKLGPDHPDALKARNNLALALTAAGRTAEAIVIHEGTLALREARLGPDHPDTLNSRSDLAIAYRATGRVDKAISLLKGTLELTASKLGPDHPGTIASRNNLAVAYNSAGRIDEALALHEGTLKLLESKLGPAHPDTLTVRNNLATASYTAGHTARAVALLEGTVKLMESKLGPDHPGTLTSRNNLAILYYATGHPDKALALLAETLRLREARLGPDHPDTLQSRSNLATAYAAAGRTAEAIPLLKKALEAREARLGPDHPDTLNGRNNLAEAYRAAGRTAEAIALHQGNLRVREARLGSDHPDTLGSRNNLALALTAVGRTTEAIVLYERTIKPMEMKLGADHPTTLTSRNNLAGTYELIGRLAEAEPLRRDTIARRRKRERPDSPALAGDLEGLGGNLLKQSKWTEAEAVLRECLAIRETKPPDDWSRFHAMSQLGGALLGQDKDAEAEPLIVPGYEGMEAREAKIPMRSKPQLLEAAVRVVQLYEAWGKPEQAKAWKEKLGLADLPADVFARP
jgi:tetratricopeptide (TPR) repeat protein